MTYPRASRTGLRGLRGLRTALHTLALLALVAASTAVLVAPELFTGQASAHRPLLLSMPALGHA